jgi:hypothetical protein
VSAEGLLVGGLLRAIQAARDERWSELAIRDLEKSAEFARNSLRRIATNRLVAPGGTVEAHPARPVYISDHLDPVQVRFVEGVQAGLKRTGSTLIRAQVAYGELLLTSLLPDGTNRTTRMRLISADWASTNGIVQSRADVVRKLSRMRRAPLTTKTEPREHLGDAQPDAQPADADRRDGRRPAPRCRTTTNPRRL